jgi:hypothetical protein
MLNLLRITATSVLNAHIDDAGLCGCVGTCGRASASRWPNTTSWRYELPPELGRSGDGASSVVAGPALHPARGRAVAPCRGADMPPISRPKGAASRSDPGRRWRHLYRAARHTAGGSLAQRDSLRLVGRGGGPAFRDEI